MFLESVQVGLTLWENRSKITKAARKVWYRLKHGKLRLAVVGLGGAGKTTLGKVVSGALDPFAGPTRYEESLTTEPYRLKHDLTCELLVVPGQGAPRYDPEWKDAFQHFSQGTAVGLIHVVSYGLDSFSHRRYSEHKTFRRGMTKAQFVDAYLKERRALELKSLRELTQALMLAKGPMWMLTVVNKQDLWWGHRIAVRDHYTSEPITKEIERIGRRLGANNFRHELLSTSLGIASFTTDSGEVLVRNSAGYDPGLQMTNLKRLMDTIVKLSISAK